MPPALLCIPCNSTAKKLSTRTNGWQVLAYLPGPHASCPGHISSPKPAHRRAWHVFRFCLDRRHLSTDPTADDCFIPLLKDPIAFVERHARISTNRRKKKAPDKAE